MKERDGKSRRFGSKRFGAEKFGAKKFGSKRFEARRPPAGDDIAHRRDLVRVAGANAVKALFARAPERIERLFFTPETKEAAAGYCRVLAKGRKIFREVPAEELARIAGTAMHGGIVAVAKPQPIGAFDAQAAARAAPRAPLLPILHGIANPHNLGAIARTAAFLGLPTLVLTDHPAQAGLSDAALRTAEGGFERLDVRRLTDLAATLGRLKGSHRVIGAAVPPMSGRSDESPRSRGWRGLSPERVPRDRPIALLLGNEETGLDTATLALCDEAVTIPGAGGVQSLNVSVAAGILFYAFTLKAS
jgi:TrmH RNA methyltransferase